MGPLSGVRVIEIASLAPAPFGCMILADLGADVLRVDRAERCGPDAPQPADPLSRGRRSIGLNLKDPAAIDVLLRLTEDADVLVEGFRPGVAERLGFGPQVCAARNPGLIFARMTGWGQDGPLAQAAGHDLNYIALTGVLHAIGRTGQPPTPPLNLVGDYGGGALYLAFGMVCALLEAQKSGKGQIVDAAMIDGAASLMTPFYGLRAAGLHGDRRGENYLDSGAPYYDVYQCADGRYLAVAAIEAKFRKEFYTGIGLDPEQLPSAAERANWPALKAIIAARLKTKTADEWCALLDGTDACVAPVLSMAEAPRHPHHVARETFIDIGGVVQPAPAPRFSRTRPATPSAPRPSGEGGLEALAQWGIAGERLERLCAVGVIRDSKASRQVFDPTRGD